MRSARARPVRIVRGTRVAAALAAAVLVGTFALRAASAERDRPAATVRASRVRNPPRPRAAHPVVPAPEVVNGEVDAVAPYAAAELPLIERTLRIVGPDGRPIAAVPVGAIGVSCNKAATDKDGRVTFLVRPEESLLVEFRDARSPRSMTLTAPLTEAVIADLPEAEIVTIDGTTGLPIGPCGAKITVWCGATHTDLEFAAGDAVRFPLPLEDDGETGLWVSARAPAGSASLDRLAWEGPVARRAQRVRVTVPVFPADTWTLRAVDAEGTPCQGVRAADVDFVAAHGAEATWVCNAEETSDTSGADGRVVVRDVPRVPLGRAKFDLQKGASWNDEDAATRLRGFSATVALDGGGASLAADVVMAPWNGSTSRTLCGGGGCGRRHRETTTTAKLTVRALDITGRAATGVHVRAAGRAATTDERGVAVLEDVSEGATWVVAYEHGFLPTAVAAVVGRDAEVLVQEQLPRRVRVTVVDPDGRPLAAVRVLPTCCWVRTPSCDLEWAETTIAQLDGDLELATPRTDASGVVDLDVPRGVIRYDATLIGAATSLGAENDDVRIVLSPPSE